MRFRYFDSEGTEVGLSSVDALRFRIETGVVTPETLLYDAAAGQWAPARQNPLFRFLVEEDESLLPEEHRPLMEGTGTSARAAPAPGAPAEEEDADPVTGAVQSDRPGGRDLPAGQEVDEEEAGDPLEGDTLDLSSMDPAGAESSAVDDDGFPAIELSIPEAPGGSESDPESEEVSERKEESAPEPASESDSNTVEEPEWDEDSDVESEIRLGSGWPAGPELAASASADPPTSDSGSSTGRPAPRSSRPTAVKKSVRKRTRREADAPAAAPSRWSPPKSKMEFRRSEPRNRRRRPPSLVGVAALSILMVFVVGIPILILGGSGEGEDGSAYALVGSLADDLISGGGPEDAEPGDESPPAVESDPEAAATGRTTPAEPARPTSAEIEELAADVEAGAAADVAEALAGLQRALDLPDGPPAEWLDDRYLAAADSFPRVERYWMSLSSLVKSMEELEGELYRGFVQNRVLRMRLAAADAERISTRALARWEESAGERRSTYRSLELLADNALALHDTLEARSELISFRPFEGAELSRYPVMAALPDHPVLAEHIWSRVGRTLDLLQSLDGSRPESVAEVQEAVRRTTLLATAGAPGAGGSGVGRSSPSIMARSGSSNPDDSSGAGEIPTAADLPVPTQDLPDLD